MLDIATRLAEEAGRLLLSRSRPGVRPDSEWKDGQVRNLVTEADRASEAFLVEGLSREFPDHGIVAEEGGGGGAEREYVWHVDPLDGTVNFAHSHPFFAVSLGLAHRGRPVLGVIHAPRLRETFAGEVGRGTTVNGDAVRVSGAGDLSSSLVATGFPYDRNVNPDHNVDNFAKIAFLVRGIRRAGAASLDLAYVAAGRFDGFWEIGLSSWDVAAGAALVLAAGGVVTDFAAGGDYLAGRNIVATNGRIHEALRTSLQPLRGPARRPSAGFENAGPSDPPSVP